MKFANADTAGVMLLKSNVSSMVNRRRYVSPANDGLYTELS